MLALIKRLLIFSGTEKKKLILSFFCKLVDAVFEMMPILAVLTVLSGVVNILSGGQMASAVIWNALIIMSVSIIGRILFTGLAAVQRTLGSFDMCVNKRLAIGEQLKRVPMGYFNENRLGELTAAVTTTLADVEMNAVLILEAVAGGFIHALVIGIWLLLYEWRIGLLMILGLIGSGFVYRLIQKSGKHYSPRRQAAQAGLVTAVLEYIQGMGVIKSFGQHEQASRATEQAIAESSSANTALERVFSALAAVYQTIFKFARAAIVIVAPYLLLGGEITIDKCLLLLVSSFMIYANVELVGSMTSVARVIEASLDRLDAVTDTPLLDERGEDYTPHSFDIELERVSFAYNEKQVIQDVSLRIPEKTTCAIVGPSGSGKTTLCRLIARFWDVQSGCVSVGGRNVKDYTCDSLLKNFSIVFQQVYLFEDSIENNIRFGCPDATHEMVIEAAKKACCHDFITALPAKYDTWVGEAGVSLSGGEKQRISIARAILKNAPIVILDEATASVDPENEQKLKHAITELTKNKTLIMIAHRLSTVRNAEQIIVLDQGKIVQRGDHDELMAQDGLYRRFIEIREKAVSWRLGGTFDD